LKKELKYNEDSHIDEKDVEQIYYAFIGKHKEFKTVKSFQVYEFIEEFFGVLESTNGVSRDKMISLLKKKYPDM
jgi:hypothetical protein